MDLSAGDRSPASPPPDLADGPRDAGAGPVDGAGAPPDTRPSPPADSAPPAITGTTLFRYDFESGTDGWRDIRFEHYQVPELPVAVSTAVPAHRGNRVLAITLRTASASVRPTFGIKSDTIKNLPAGARIRQWVWFPAGSPLEGIQAFVYYYQQGTGARWGGKLTVIGLLTPGAWNLLERDVPADVDYAAGGVIDFGLEFPASVALTQSLQVYVDDVTVTAP